MQSSYRGTEKRTLETMRNALCMLIMVNPSRSSPRKRDAHRKRPLPTKTCETPVEKGRQRFVVVSTDSNNVPSLCLLLVQSSAWKKVEEHGSISTRSKRRVP